MKRLLLITTTIFLPLTFTPSIIPAQAQASTSAVHRFYNLSTGTHFFTASEDEKNHVLTNNRAFTYEGTGYEAFVYYKDNATCTSGSPIYRFYQPDIQTHLYTISTVERDNVKKIGSSWTYEHIAFCAYENEESGTLPVYRFWNLSKGGHFYTISESEKDATIANPGFVFEGIGFYIPDTLENGSYQATTFADASIHKNVPAKNTGSDQTINGLYTFTNESVVENNILLFAFNAKTMPINQKLLGASLTLPIKESKKGHLMVTIAPYRGWKENTVTYQSMVNQSNSNATVFDEFPVVGSLQISKTITEPTYITIPLDTTSLPSFAGENLVAAVQFVNKEEGIQVLTKENTMNMKPAYLTATFGESNTIEQINGDVLTPATIPLDSANIIAPMRGLYQWINSQGKHNPYVEPSYDLYDRFTWNEIEVQKDVYDFSIIDQLKDGIQPGQKIAFRIRAMLVEGNSLPDYMQVEPYTFTCNGQRLPNWNSPEFKQRVQLLLKKLGEKYNNNQTAFIDATIYGKYGEAHLSGFPAECEASQQTLREYFDMFVQSFSNVQLLAMYGDPEVAYALQTVKRNNYGPIGLRSDTIGASSLLFKDSMIRSFDKFNILKDNYKYAPFVTEFVNKERQDIQSVYATSAKEVQSWHLAMIGNGNTYRWDELSSDQRSSLNRLGKITGYRYALNKLVVQKKQNNSITIQTSWSNEGSTATYEPWRLLYIFTKEDGTQSRVNSNLNISSIGPTSNYISGEDNPYIFTENVNLPSNLPAGTYTVSIILEDTRTDFKRTPLQLANEIRLEDGSYVIGQINL